MEKKYYQIIAKTPEDWKVVHKLLMQDGTLEDNIPCHCIECANEIKHSKTRSTYLMTDEEADLVRQSDRIQGVSLDPQYHPEVAIVSEPCIKKYGIPVRNYRSLRKYNPSTNTYDYSIPNTSYDGRTSGEFRRTGYQILRCTSEQNPFSSNSLEVKNQDIDYYTDGSDIDLIVVDDGCFFGHPEFCYDEYTATIQNYIGGNVLSRHGICGVLDLILDAPYYLDPEWFDADPTNRLVKRWDGTTVPEESFAKNWWYTSQYRSPSFPDFGSISIKNSYTREFHCGLDQKTPPSSPSKGGHGTPCASLAFGKNFGWAFNSNKWSVAGNIGVASGQILESLYDILKIFHLYKPINPKFGTKNPTVTSNSYGNSVTIQNLFFSDPFNTHYSYRNGSPQRYSYPGSYPNFLSTYNPSDNFPLVLSDNKIPVISGKEMIDAGVIFIGAAGNDGRYLGTPTDEDYNNYITSDPSATVQNQGSDIIGTIKYWTNRPGFPLQIGETGTLSRYKTFAIGAIDDEYTGRYTNPPIDDPVFSSEPSGKETLARSGEITRFGDYSNKGSAIDFYAPGDGTLAASSEVSSSSSVYQNPYQKYSNIVYNDMYFNGTSSACPVAAGLIACFLQNNRDLASDPLDLKNYLRNNIRSQNSSQFFIGPRPGNDPDDPAWTVPFSVMGRSVKIIKEVTTRNATPNPTFTRTYGIAAGSGANERFTVTSNAAIDHKMEIFGIKNFDGTIEQDYDFNIKTGYYKVGARTWFNISYDQLSKIKLRIDPTNSKKIQLSDSDGVDSWDDMEITVTNGEFVQSSTEFYYVFSGGPYISSSATGPGYSPTSGTGSITSTNGDLIITGNISSGDDIIGLVSDERLKENVNIINNALEKIDNLEGFTYNFNEIGEKLGFDPNKRYSGVSAQNVKDILPEASAPAPRDNDYLTVKYDKLIPLLIEGIKDLKNEIDDIKGDDDNK